MTNKVPKLQLYKLKVTFGSTFQIVLLSRKALTMDTVIVLRIFSIFLITLSNYKSVSSKILGLPDEDQNPPAPDDN